MFYLSLFLESTKNSVEACFRAKTHPAGGGVGVEGSDKTQALVFQGPDLNVATSAGV